MRASPACQVSLRRFGAWRSMIAALSFLGALTVAAWLLGRDAPPTAWWWACGFALVAMLGLAVSLSRLPAKSLRWDGQAWQLDAVPGDLRIAIDLGPWMLLRFVPAGGARACWLPVQRRGLEAQWHLLRCAVYSPRPVAER